MKTVTIFGSSLPTEGSPAYENARRLGKPVTVVVGSWDPALRLRLKRRGIDRVFALTDRVSRSRALREAPKLLADAAQRAVESY